MRWPRPRGHAQVGDEGSGHAAFPNALRQTALACQVHEPDSGGCIRS